MTEEELTYYYRKHNLYKYRISPEEYNEQLEKQNFECAICHRHVSQFKRTLAVDHCHITGNLRGLLCGSCNSGIGKLQDSIELLQSAINYLKQPYWKTNEC